MGIQMTTPHTHASATIERREFVSLLLANCPDALVISGFATVGAQQPANLTLVVLDKGNFGETGM